MTLTVVDLLFIFAITACRKIATGGFPPACFVGHLLQKSLKEIRRRHNGTCANAERRKWKGALLHLR